MSSKKPPKTADGSLTLSTNQFPVVGIGASAGGLDAFKKLVKAIPEKSGMAFVLVQHLDPKHNSVLPELLQKVTTIPVMEITDDIKVLPDHIYIIPSNKMLIANDGVLELSPRTFKKNERNLPIDLFFSSLAEIHQSHSIGVVLSGTANDGTRGLKSIREQGGITIAQTEESAAFDGMPHSAIQSGMVDFILAPEEIPSKLMEVTKIITRNQVVVENIPEKDSDVFSQILLLLRNRKGTDFTYYKQTTIRRRILRRMALNKNEGPLTYLKYLRENEEEQDLLYQDLLIPVTEFFRDDKTFDSLCNTAFQSIIKNKIPNDPIRIWVAGCSTGEEAYSIAISLKEFLGVHQERIQIFATDISEPAITKARTGMYTKSEVAGVSAERLQEFFIKVNGRFQVIKQIRNLCVFAVHNFLKDPPFGKMDLISCRNVLIYFEPSLQRRALTTFHYSMNTKGQLLLGKSETISSVPDLFGIAKKGEKLYSRKDIPPRYSYTTNRRGEQSVTDMNSTEKPDTKSRMDFQKAADDIILGKYTPAGVVVNEEMDIVHFRGKTSNYLEQLPGRPSHNLLKMAKEGLAFEIRSIIHSARKLKAPFKKKGITLKLNNIPSTIAIEAIPLLNTAEPHYLILFHEDLVAVSKQTARTNKITADKQVNANKDLRIQQLEEQLAQVREDMRSISEEQEAANEELQSGNEELLSTGEELQSMNEELETSKEELQSTNEELTVVNQELINLNEQVTAARDYAENIIANIRESLLVLDKHQRIVTASKSFYKTFRVSEQETLGFLIYDLGNRQWNIPALRLLLENILPESAVITDFEVKHTFSQIGERTMLLNAREVQSEKNKDKLILLSIADITEQKKAQEVLNKKSDQLEENVQQRTIELSAANIELQRKNKELQSFNYISSHDLQEPLRKIQIFANRIRSEEFNLLTEKGKEDFSRIQEAAGRMQTLIEDLLAYARTDITKRELENTDLAGIIETTKKELSETIREKGAIIEVGQLCRVNINPLLFQQVMNNLITNSIKFSKAGVSPYIIITSKTTEAAQLQDENPHLAQNILTLQKKYCHISVKDNGIGFDPKYKDLIFEVFQRLYGKDEYPGTGIGLSIVKKIVENHNGFITATGEPGVGATFDIYIPA